MYTVFHHNIEFVMTFEVYLKFHFTLIAYQEFYTEKNTNLL